VVWEGPGQAWPLPDSAGGGGQTTSRKRDTAARLRPIIAICRATSRNVKRWQSGDMCLRWTAAGMLEAERQFRKIIGYKHLAHLALAVERDVATTRAVTNRPTNPPTTESATRLPAAH
jgi:hypothetical protein